MRRFSWYTDEKPSISTYLNGATKKRYLVVDGIAVIGRCVTHYKPNRKGGHRHNHIYNVCNRITFRGKKSRRVKPDDKKYFVSIFWENIALMPDVLNKILANKRNRK